MSAAMFKQVVAQPWIPRAQSVRFMASNKINIGKPKLPHFKKSVMLKVARPRYPVPPIDAFSICGRLSERHQAQTNIENPYEVLLAKELTNWVENSKFIALFQELNMTGEERFDSFAILKRKGIHLEVLGQQVARRAFTGTKYEALLPLLIFRNSIAFAEEPTAVKTLMSLRKKLRFHVLITGVVEDRLMTVSQLEKYAALPDLTSARVQLAQILNGVSSPSCRLVSQLNTHQQNLVSNLEARIEQLKVE